MRGFLLDAGYRIERGATVLQLWGVREDGTSFLVRDRRPEPHFFVRQGDGPAALALGAAAVEPSPLRAMGGEPVARVVLATPADARPLADRLAARGIPSFEADLRFTQRCLIDRELRGGLLLPGTPRPGDLRRGERVAWVYDDPDLLPAELEPELRVLSLDIKTLPDLSTVLSVALHGPGVAEVIVLGGGGGKLPGYAAEVADERALLSRLEERFAAIDPDALTGWNLVGFDLTVLERRARELGRTLVLGRGPLALRVRGDRAGPWGSSGQARAEVEGRAVIDGLDLLRGAYIRVEDHRLDTVAKALLGEGKLLAGRGREQADEIRRLWASDLETFCAYNLRDAELVSRILDRAGLVRLAVRRSLLAGQPLPRVGASIASLDSLYLPELRRRGLVAPTLGALDQEEEPAATLGGAVLEPVPGLHEGVVAFDFKSLYPSLIRTFNIDPLSHVRDPGPGEDLIRTPSGACFRREPGILPGLLGRLLEVREAARRSGDAVAAQATKILMNSFYGALATSACRFHSSALANAITAAGQALLYWTKARFEARGYRALYGDTDSLFVQIEAAPGDLLPAAEALRAEMNAEVATHLAAAHGVESRLELEVDAVFRRLFLPHVRHGVEGARKRYAGLALLPGGGEQLLFVGMETVRRDWTEAARELQRGLYARLFADQPVADYVRGFVAAVRAGEKDAQLVYRKSLRKALDAYTATTPPHVQAARQEASPSPVVEYVVTREGPVPLGPGRRLDYGHYLEKQLRPIAEAVLPLLGLDWDELAGNPRQLSLF